MSNIEWSHTPPKSAVAPNLQLIRTPARGTFSGLIVSEHLTGCWTHFFGGTTIPCTATSCPACAQLSSKRWHGYLAIYDPTNTQTVLLELTAQACTKISEHQNQFASLHGMGISTTRFSNRPNAKIKVLMRPETRGKYLIPDPIDVEGCLRKIWKLDENQRQPDNAKWETAAIKESLQRNNGNGAIDRAIH